MTFLHLNLFALNCVAQCVIWLIGVFPKWGRTFSEAWNQDPVSHMCLAGAVLSPFTAMTNIFVTEFSETVRKNSNVLCDQYFIWWLTCTWACFHIAQCAVAMYYIANVMCGKPFCTCLFELYHVADCATSPSMLCWPMCQIATICNVPQGPMWWVMTSLHLSLFEAVWCMVTFLYFSIDEWIS